MNSFEWLYRIVNILELKIFVMISGKSDMDNIFTQIFPSQIIILDFLVFRILFRLLLAFLFLLCFFGFWNRHYFKVSVLNPLTHFVEVRYQVHCALTFSCILHFVIHIHNLFFTFFNLFNELVDNIFLNPVFFVCDILAKFIVLLKLCHYFFMSDFTVIELFDSSFDFR